MFAFGFSCRVSEVSSNVSLAMTQASSKMIIHMWDLNGFVYNVGVWFGNPLDRVWVHQAAT